MKTTLVAVVAKFSFCLKIGPLTFLIIYATARLTFLRSLTTLLCELNCARSDTKFLIAHVLVVVVAEWP